MSYGDPKAIDLTGQRIGRLVVVRRDGVDSAGNARWLCKCDCGAECSPSRITLRKKDGKERSCGCVRTEKRRARGAA